MMRRLKGYTESEWLEAVRESPDLQEQQLIDEAGITDPTLRMGATVLLAARRGLHMLAAELGKPVDEISREDIVASFKPKAR
jgi:hypothetical protein